MFLGRGVDYEDAKAFTLEWLDKKADGIAPRREDDFAQAFSDRFGTSKKTAIRMLDRMSEEGLLRRVKIELPRATLRDIRDGWCWLYRAA